MKKPEKQKAAGRRLYIQLGLSGSFGVFILISFLTGYNPGIQIAGNSWEFLFSMITLFPGAFILIGLFEVWVDRSIVEKHLGRDSGLAGYFWVILLACTIMAPLIVALPLARSLSQKGARLQMVIAFLSASTICRIPMTVLEATYLGIPFSLVRLLVSLPIVIISSEIIGRIFHSEEIVF